MITKQLKENSRLVKPGNSQPDCGAIINSSSLALLPLTWSAKTTVEAIKAPLWALSIDSQKQRYSVKEGNNEHDN